MPESKAIVFGTATKTVCGHKFCGRIDNFFCQEEVPLDIDNEYNFSIQFLSLCVDYQIIY